jgi:salicylate hydroxylase
MKYCILLFLLYNIDIILSFCISTNLYYKNNYNVSIIGGSIVGLATCIAFKKKGFNVNIYDKKIKLRSNGESLRLTEDSEKSLKLISKEAYDNINLNSVNIKRTLFKDIYKNKINYNYNNIKLTSSRDIQKYLLNNIDKDNINLNYNFKDYYIDNKTNLININFDNNITIKTNLLIGADGIDSLVRKCMLGDVQKYYYNKVIYRGIIDKKKVPDYLKLKKDTSVTWFDSRINGQIFSWKEISHNLMCFTGTKNLDNLKIHYNNKITTLNAFKRFPNYVKNIIGLISNDSIYIKKIKDIDICEKWYDKNVLLIGDAAHAIRNDMGINVNINLADVSELIKCIDKDNIDNSLKLWEKNRNYYIYKNY